MTLSYKKIEEDDKKLICSWKYSGKYSIYNLKPYEEQRRLGVGFCNADKEGNYYCIFDAGVLVAFINLSEKDEEVLLGVGVNPDFLNMGYGKKTIAIASEIADDLYPDKLMYLEVRSFNKRAINCYRSAGFEIDGEMFMKTTPIGKGEFFRMVKNK